MKNNDILNGDIITVLLRLSLPLIGSLLLETFFNMVDAMWLGWNGTEVLAAANLSAFPLWMMYAVIAIVSVGTNSLVAQKLGEATIRSEAKQEAENIASIGLFLTIWLGLVQGAAVLIWGRQLMSFMAGGDPVLVELGYCYLGFIFLFCPIYCINEVLTSILRAYGDTKTPTYVFAFTCILNLILDPLFIFGWLGCPRWDIFGAALASNISYSLGTLLLIYLMVSKRVVYQLAHSRPKDISWSMIWSMIKIGGPPALASFVFTLVYMLISPVVSSFGVEAVAALGIGHRLEGLSYVVCYAISLACITMVGQNVGARQYERAEAIAEKGLQLAVILASIIALLFLLVPKYLVYWFSGDPQVHATAILYLRILAIPQLFAALGSITDGVFSGVGKTWPPMCVSVPCSLARVPIVYLITSVLGYGVIGVWLTIGIMTSVRGALMFLLFVKGVWKTWSESEGAQCEGHNN